MCGLTFNYKLPGQNFSPLVCHYVTCMLTLIENWGGGGYLDPIVQFDFVYRNGVDSNKNEG